MGVQSSSSYLHDRAGFPSRLCGRAEFSSHLHDRENSSGENSEADVGLNSSGEADVPLTRLGDRVILALGRLGGWGVTENGYPIHFHPPNISWISTL